MVSVRYQISEDDFVAATRLALKTKSPFPGSQRWYFPALGALIIAGTLVARPWQSDKPGPATAGIVMGLLFIWAGVAYTRTIRKQFRKTPAMGDLRTLVADEQGLQFSSDLSNGRSAWAAYVRFGEDSTSFVLFQQGSRIFIPIPKRELLPGEIEGLRELFQAHLPRK